eukprot:1158307-Pelagomonas_calceolata.AAC.12
MKRQCPGCNARQSKALLVVSNSTALEFLYRSLFVGRPLAGRQALYPHIFNSYPVNMVVSIIPLHQTLPDWSIASQLHFLRLSYAAPM